MKILLLIPLTDTVENVVRDVLYGCWCKGKRIGGAKVPPLVLLSVATVLKEDENEVRLLDAPAEDMSLNDVKKLVKKYDVLLLLTSTMTFNEDADVLAELKKSNKKLITVIFGSHPTFMPEYCLKKKGVDIIVRKEPEYVIRDLVRALREKLDWKETNGIGFKDKKIVINPDYPFIDIEDLPICDRSLLPKDVVYDNPIVKKYPYTTSETSRGCPGRCYFCTAPQMYGEKIRYWSAEKVIREIEELKRLGYKEIYYRDETFTTFKERNIKICNEIISRKLKISWLCNVRIGTVDKETLALMKKAGCHTIKIGVESGVQEILNKSNKGVRVEDTEKLFRWARECGMNTHAHLMLGMPGETKETIKKTVEFVKKINPNTIDVGICTPYPGTKLFSDVAKDHPEIKDGTSVGLGNLHTDGSFNVHFTNLTKEDLEKALSDFYRSFYMRPSHAIRNVLQIRSYSDFKRIYEASLNLLKFIVKKGKD